MYLRDDGMRHYRRFRHQLDCGARNLRAGAMEVSTREVIKESTI